MIVDILLFFVGWSNHMECFGLAHAEVKYRFLSLSKNILQILSGECSTASQLLCSFAHHEAPASYESPLSLQKEFPDLNENQLLSILPAS